MDVNTLLNGKVISFPSPGDNLEADVNKRICLSLAAGVSLHLHEKEIPQIILHFTATGDELSLSITGEQTVVEKAKRYFKGEGIIVRDP